MNCDTMWWQRQHALLAAWRSGDIGSLTDSLRAVLTRKAAVSAYPITGAAISEIVAQFSDHDETRYQQLRTLWRDHELVLAGPQQRAAIPHGLWDKLLAQLGFERQVPESRWIDARSRADQAFHHGAQSGPWTEWWGWPHEPGAYYDNRLWAWGAVTTEEQCTDRGHASTDLAAFSPRLAWRPNYGRWVLHPLLTRYIPAVKGANNAMMLPRLHDGPGFLLACIVDALYEMQRNPTFTGRDRAVIWGTMLLPVIAPSIEIEGAHLGAQGASNHEGTSGPLPDYAQMLPFFLLHPRIQHALLALDQLCTFYISGDFCAMEALLRDLERDLPACPDSQMVCTEVMSLIVELGKHANHRRGARDWDSGFGFRIFRKLLRDRLPEKSCITATIPDLHTFATDWDQQIHGSPPDIANVSERARVGAHAQSLREAMSTALWSPGHPRYPDGPVAQQIIDKVWLRWTDDAFLDC